MSEIESNAYAKGFQVGWNKCREFLCEKFTLNKDEVMFLERNDSEGDNHESTKETKVSKLSKGNDGLDSSNSNELNLEKEKFL